MTIAGLDIATRTGLCILDGERLVHWEAHRPRGDEDAQIFAGFRAWLIPTLRAHEVEHAAIEQPLVTDIEIKEVKHDLAGPRTFKRRPVSMNTYLRLYGLFGHACEILYSLNIPFEVVHQATWRKAFIGSGRADKDQAVAQCKLLGWNITSKDAAEAAGISWWLRGHLSPVGQAMSLFEQKGAA